MCWTNNSDKNCKKCEEHFDKCTHDVTYINDEGREVCMECERPVSDIIHSDGKDESLEDYFFKKKQPEKEE